MEVVQTDIDKDLLRKNTKRTERRRGRQHIAFGNYKRALETTVNDFLKATKGNTSADDAEVNFRLYDHRWRQHCHKTKQDNPWMKVDEELFASSVSLISKKAQRRMQPVRYYWNNYGIKLLAAAALGGFIYLITEHVAPVFQAMF